MYAELSLDSCIEQPELYCGLKSCQNNKDLLTRKIDLLNEVIIKIDDSIKCLSRKENKLSKEKIQDQLQRISYEIGNNVMLEKNNFGDKIFFSQKSSLGLDSTLTFSSAQKIYEIPIQINVQSPKDRIYEVPLDLEKFDSPSYQDIQEYFNLLQKWNDLQTPLQKSIQRLIKTKPVQTSPPKNVHLDLSFFKCQELQENLDGSFSFSEVRKRRISEVSVKQTVQTYAQTDNQAPMNQQIMKKGYEKVYEIPLQFTVQVEREDRETQTKLTDLGEQEKNMNHILGQVDIVLQEIQDLLHEIIPQEESDEELKIEEIKNARIPYEYQQDQNIDMQADEVMSRLSKLLHETPEYLQKIPIQQYEPKPLQKIQEQIKNERKTSKDENIDEITHQLENTISNLHKIFYQNYEIPIEIQLMSDCEESIVSAQEEVPKKILTVEEARLDENYLATEIENQKNLDDQMEIIRRIIEQNPLQLDQYFKVGDLPLEESEPCYMQDANNPQWEEVNGQLFNMGSILKSISREILPVDQADQLTKKDQQIQTGVELCRIDSDYLVSQKEWEEINNSIFNIQRSLNEIPRENGIKEQITSRKLSEICEEYEERKIGEYQIPIDMEVVRSVQNSDDSQYFDAENSVVSQSQSDITQERRFSEQVLLTCQTFNVAVKNYDIPCEMDLIESDQQNIVEETETLKQVQKSTNLSMQSNLINEMFVNIVEPTKVYEIPIEVYIEEDLNSSEQVDGGCIEEGEEIEEDDYIEENQPIWVRGSYDGSQSEQSEEEQAEMPVLEIKKKQISTQTDLQEVSPQKEENQLEISIRECSSNYPPDSLDMSIRPLKTNRIPDIEPLEFRGFGDSANIGKIIDLDLSEGNQTDRSALLQRAMNNSSYKDRTPSITSRFFKEDSINAADFFQLKENIKYIEEQRDKLIQTLIQSDNQLRKLEKENKIQSKYIDDMNKLHEHQQNAFSVQICFKTQTITKLQAQITFNLGIIDTLQREKQLQIEEIQELEKQLENKCQKINEAADEIRKIEDTMNAQMDKIKVEYEEKTNDLQEREKEFKSEISSLKEQMEELKNINEELLLENNKLLAKNNEHMSKIDELGQKESELMEGIETALIELDEDKSSPEKKIKNLYKGQFKKKQKVYEDQISSKDIMVKKLQQDKQKLEEKLSVIEQNMKEYQSMHNSMLNPTPSHLGIMTSVFCPQAFPQSEIIQGDYDYDMQAQVIAELSKKLSNSNSELLDKDAQINQLRTELQNMKEKLESYNSTPCKKRYTPVKQIVVEEVYDQSSIEYINKLESVLKTYEQIINDNQYEIKELHKNLLEAMEDGLTKEVQLEELEQILNRANLPMILEEEDTNKFLNISLENDSFVAPPPTPQQSLVEQRKKELELSQRWFEESQKDNKNVHGFNSTAETRNQGNSSIWKPQQKRLMKKEGNQTLRPNLESRY